MGRPHADYIGGSEIPWPDDWDTEAACRDIPNPEIFFPNEGFDRLGRRTSDEAIAICETCPVIAQCLDFALKNKIDHGIWGGKTENQRRKMRESPAARQRRLDYARKWKKAKRV